MNLLKVDQNRCVQCGLCAEVCPRGLIHLTHEWPEGTEMQLCVACGQCVAVCPSSALDNARAPLANQRPLTEFSPPGAESARFFLRSRRSIRSFQQNQVPRDKLSELMDIARFAPSGGNSQGISYLIIDRPEILRKMTAQTIAWMEAPTQQKSIAANVYNQYIAMYRKNERDSILRDAPALVLGFAAKNFARGRENTLLSLEYVELLAPTLGLGTCWAGLLEAAAFNGYAPLLELLGIPESKQLTGALMVGYPRIVFQRLVDRDPLDLAFLED